MVISLTRLPLFTYKSSNSSIVPPLTYSAFWAPFLLIAINGPSRLIPITFAPPWFSSLNSFIASTMLSSFSFGSVIDVGQNDVTPCFASSFAIFLRPSLSASDASPPAQPWICTSIKPGIIILPAISLPSPSRIPICFIFPFSISISPYSFSKFSLKKVQFFKIITHFPLQFYMQAPQAAQNAQRCLFPF